MVATRVRQFLFYLSWPQAAAATRDATSPTRTLEEITMATSMKRSNRIGELIARLLDRQSGDTAPGRLSGHGPSGMNQQPRVRWSDNSGAVVGSPRHIQEKLAAYQARGWGQQETGRSARQPQPALIAAGIANQEPRNTSALTPSLRSSRSTWADNWQR